jgi:hypothetical protein
MEAVHNAVVHVMRDQRAVRISRVEVISQRIFCNVCGIVSPPARHVSVRGYRVCVQRDSHTNLVAIPLATFWRIALGLKLVADEFEGWPIRVTYCGVVIL